MVLVPSAQVLNANPFEFISIHFQHLLLVVVAILLLVLSLFVVVVSGFGSVGVEGGVCSW